MHDSPEWIRQIATRWRWYNQIYLNGQLTSPSFAVDRSESRLGSWHAATRVIAISERHARNDPWTDVLETLRHEMAHQFAHEVLRAGDEPPHGEAFKHACVRLRVGPGATESCDERSVATFDEDDGIRGKVEKLLSLASSPNENEAQAAMKKARELLLLHNVELKPRTEFFIRQVGTIKKRHETWEYALASILSNYFFVQAIWVPSFDVDQNESGTRVELYGTRSHLDMADYVHGYLVRLLPELWESYKRQKGVRRNRDRRGYFAGVLEGLDSRLREQDRELHARHAIVRKGDPRLLQYYRHVNPNVRTIRGGSSPITDAYQQGVDDGKSVTIHKPISQSGGAGGFLTG